jgi:hemerythrin
MPEAGLKWTDDYATGVARIDEQHRMIFKMAGDFREALDSGEGNRTYGVLLEFLDHYCRSHFAFEEQIAQEHRCPFAEQNRTAHAKFTVALRGFQQLHATSGYRAGDARDLVDTVDRWLAGHICTIDVKLRDCVSSVPGSAA